MGRVETKWHKIGVQLGIPRNKLLEFEEERDPLSAVVDYWLKGNVAELVVPISWKSIVTALESDYIGELGLAGQIRKQYCQIEVENGEQTISSRLEKVVIKFLLVQIFL